jgi:L-ascorbate metabolism protein UlaG (beta-lactamase superfamily)
MEGIGITTARALDWWDSMAVGGVTVHLVPVQHWTRRAFADTNACLWGGFVVEAGTGAARRSVFFGGDTGYSSEHFTSIGAKLGPIDLALIPIGAYEPRWFMSTQHVNPEEAVRVHVDLRARRSLGVHWGTFQMTDEPLDQPVRDLAAAREKYGLSESEFVTVRHGQTLTFD